MVASDKMSPIKDNKPKNTPLKKKSKAQKKESKITAVKINQGAAGKQDELSSTMQKGQKDVYKETLKKKKENKKEVKANLAAKKMQSEETKDAEKLTNVRDKSKSMDSRKQSKSVERLSQVKKPAKFIDKSNKNESKSKERPKEACKTNERKRIFLFKIFLINTLQFVPSIFNNFFNRYFRCLTN